MAEGDLITLGRAARAARDRRHPGGRATFIIDRNINYTNVCLNRCRFCAFYRDAEAPDAYLLSHDQILAKVAEAEEAGATQVMIQGGLREDLPLSWFTSLFASIRERFPGISIHSLSPPEVAHLAEREGASVGETLAALRASGLGSLPGGGAEVLSDPVREEVSPRKLKAGPWLAVMEEAHRLGMRTTATMMVGTVDTFADRAAHLAALRDLQDRSGGFMSFIPWTFQSPNTELPGRPVSAVEYLRLLAVARLFLDNFDHVQGSWLTQGKPVGQLSLLFGGDDLGSVMLEENVVRAAGVRAANSVEEMTALIRGAGFLPVQRDTFFRTVREFA